MQYAKQTVIETMGKALKDIQESEQELRKLAAEGADPDELLEKIKEDSSRFIRAYDAMCLDNNRETRREFYRAVSTLSTYEYHIRRIDDAHYRNREAEGQTREADLLALKFDKGQNILKLLNAATGDTFNTTELERVGYYKFVRP